jgi:hypothetical protein
MSDLTTILADLAASTRDFIAALDGVTAAEWDAHPLPGRWSVGETAEHTAVVLHGIERLCSTRMLAMPLAADDPSRRVQDGELVRRMGDRIRALTAPDMVKPKGRWATREELIRDFAASSDALIAWAREHSSVLRTIGAPHPIFGPLDAVQWLEFLAAHTNRHAQQVAEIRRVGGV